MDSLIDVKSLKKFLESNPNLMSQVVGYKKPGRKPGVKDEPQQVKVEVEVPNEEENVETISYHKAKKMGIITRKPRQLTEEYRAKMKENLQKGREALKAYQEAKRKEKAEKKEQEINNIVEEKVQKKMKEISLVKDPTKPTKKYIVAPRKKHVKQATTDDSELSELELSDTDTTTDTTDVETKRIRRKVDKKSAVLKTIDKQLSALPPTTQPVRMSKYGNLF
jgi:hypothetical protein